MIRAIALDDEPPALRVLTHFCRQVDFIDLQRTFTRPDEARHYLEQPGVDLLFLDINMPLVSGTDFYRAIDTVSTRPPMVIFTTAYAEYAVEGFTLNAVDYLLKPFTFERFLQAVNKAADYLRWQQQPNPTREPYLYVRADYTLYKIALADILFIEGLDDYLKIHLQAGVSQAGAAGPVQVPPGPLRLVVARMTMKAMLEKLPGASTPGASTPGASTPGASTPGVGFIRVHRSYIVPVGRIEGVRHKMISVAGRDIPIGASYEADFFRQFGG